MRFELAFALIALAAPALAQQQHGHAENHDWYKYLNTKSGKSCCSGDRDHGDCRIAQARLRSDGQWEAYFRGSLSPGQFPGYMGWFIISPDVILPDYKNLQPLHAHICEQNGFVYCFLRGGSGS
jgi:hypothetical protein